MGEHFLWKFYRDCDGFGYLEGLFTATKYEVEGMIGKKVNFIDALGCYNLDLSGESEVIKEEDITKVKLSYSQQLVMQISWDIGVSWSGFDPRDYIECDSCQKPQYDCFCELK